MGGDGGSIQGRQEMVRQRAKQVIVDKNSAVVGRFTNCALTQERLKPPIVIDDLGNLLNKDSLIAHHLLADPKVRLPKFSHIRALKDVREVKLHPFEIKDSPDVYFSCPVTQLPANGKHRFVVMRHCGCALSERALHQIPSAICLACQKPIPEDLLTSKEHLILINPTSAEEMDAARDAMDKRRLRVKDAKEKDKRKPPTDVAGTATTESGSTLSAEETKQPSTDATSSAGSVGSLPVQTGSHGKKRAHSPTPAGAMLSGSKVAKSSRQSDASTSSLPGKTAGRADGNSSKRKADAAAHAAESAAKVARASSSLPSTVGVDMDQKLKAALSGLDERLKKDKVLGSLFFDPKEMAKQKFSQISTKMESGMSRL